MILPHYTRSGDMELEVWLWDFIGQAERWQAQEYHAMLVIRTPEDQICWMDITEYLRWHGTRARQIVFEGEPFTALSVVRLRDRLLR